eukprot:310802-Prorocentrum_lima.AAC.1
MAQKYYHQVYDYKSKLDDLENKHLYDVTNMQAHIEVQGNEDTLLRAQLESLQERQSIVAQQ